MRKAAENGHKIAQYNMHILYNQGEGVPQSDKESLRWLKESAIRGYPNAQADLGSYYLNCNNYDEGVPWIKAAAEKNDPFAQWTMGVLHETGKGGFLQDEHRAKEWYKKAASQGYEPAEQRLKEGLNPEQMNAILEDNRKQLQLDRSQASTEYGLWHEKERDKRTATTEFGLWNR